MNQIKERYQLKYQFTAKEALITHAIALKNVLELQKLNAVLRIELSLHANGKDKRLPFHVVNEAYLIILKKGNMDLYGEFNHRFGNDHAKGMNYKEDVNVMLQIAEDCMIALDRANELVRHQI